MPLNKVEVIKLKAARRSERSAGMLKGRRLLILPEINQSIPERLINKRLNESESCITGLRIIAIIIIAVQRARRKPRKWPPLSLTTAAAALVIGPTGPGLVGRLRVGRQ